MPSGPLRLHAAVGLLPAVIGRGPHLKGPADAGHGLALVPDLRAERPNQVWSWAITYLPNTIRGVWLYPYLFIDV